MARVGVGWGTGVRVEEEGRKALGRPASLTRASAETSPPARAAPRPPARRLSPEREPGRGQGEAAPAAPGLGAAPGGVRLIRRSRRCSQELRPPPARTEALFYLPPSATAPPGPGARAGWCARGGACGLRGGGACGGGAWFGGGACGQAGASRAQSGGVPGLPVSGPRLGT